MKHTRGLAMLLAVAGVSAGLVMAPVPVQGQPASAARKENLAERFELSATTLSVFNRQGKVVAAVGPRDMYGAAVFSPDAKRLAIVRIDLENESRDVWVLELATHNWTRITTSSRTERAFTPAWSPDGTQIAYGALRGGNFGLYRKPSNGQGTEELLYQAPGAPLLSDWSMDGRFLSFVTNELRAGGALHVLPLDGERKPVEVYRCKRQVQGGWFSPDSRFLSLTSNDSGRNEVYVIPREGTVVPVRIPDQGPASGGQWRRDGKELYLVRPDQSVMAVEVSTSPVFQAGKPTLLFRQSVANHEGFNISRDGERIVMAETPTRLRQITLFDRQGNVVKKVGQPGFYLDPSLSPDGNRVVMERRDPSTGNTDIWTMDLATGRTYAVTNDSWPKFDAHWGPDGKQVAYEATHDEYTSAYRKAWDGSGQEELLFRDTPGAGMSFTDWSRDGKFLAGSNGALLMIPLRANEQALERKAIDWMREEYDVSTGRFSPDMRFVAYLSNEADVSVDEVYIRAFDASKPEAPGAGAPVRIPASGARALLNWRQDGKELYLVTRAWEVAAVDVRTAPDLQTGAPKVLFRLPGPLPGDTDSWKNVDANGERFVFAIPVK